MEDVKRALESGSLFESKKLVVIEHAFSSSEPFPQVKSAAESARQASDMILILWDGALDGPANERLREIQDIGAKSQEFKTLASREFRKWIEEEARARDVAVRLEDLLRFESCGANLWQIANELDKMALGGGHHMKSSGTFSVGPPNIFNLGDAFFTSRVKALPELFNLLDGGHDEFNAFSYLSNQARNMLLVKSCEEQRKPLPKSIAPHPFVIKKAAAIARIIPVEDLRRGVKRFFEEDFKIKIGLSRPKESLIHMLFSPR